MKKPALSVERIEAREAIKHKRALLRDVKKHKAIALRDAREAIKRSRVELRKKLAHWREVNRQILARAIEAERHHAKAQALEKLHGTSGRAGELARAALASIDADVKHLRWLGHQKHHAKSPARIKAGLRAAELRAESDEFVKRELPVEFHAAWEKHKHTIRGTKLTPRWQVALDWFHDHSAQVAEANREAAAVDLKRTIATEAAHHEAERARFAKAKAKATADRVKKKTITERAKNAKRAKRGRSRVPF